MSKEVKLNSEEVKLTEEELSKLQAANDQLTKIKVTIGDFEVKKAGLFKQLDLLQADFAKLEDGFVEKYGADAVINMKTGIVTKKSE